MKNFRKVLALVLVVATLFSFAAMAGAKYEDAEAISYEEAVDVLSAVGILNGYEVAEDEFKFDPTNTISREEMAKMIAVMANAGTDVSKLYAAANTFADVEATRWSASYIAYCAQTGIVAGRSATTFDPVGKVTGLETAKMLLVVLGFDAAEQGYVGANWKLNVLKDAKVMGLLNGFAAGYDIEAAITREEAAQMMLNALEAPCVVGILSDSIIKVTNALVYTDSVMNVADVVKVNSYATLKDAMSAGDWALYGNVVISDDVLYTELYNGRLVKTTAQDCYGRPTTKWTLTSNGKEVFSGSYKPAALWSSTNTTVAKLQAALDAYEEIEMVYYYDGVKVDDPAVVNYVDDVATVLNWGFGIGKGTLVEAYISGGLLYVININTYIGEIASVNTFAGTFTLADGTTWKNEFGFKTANVGDKILYNVCQDTLKATGAEMHAAKLATPVTVKATDAYTVSGDIAKSSFVAGGKTYEYANTFDKNTFDGLDILGEGGVLFADSIDVYVDDNGFVMYWEPTAAAAPNYAVIPYASIDQTPVKNTLGQGPSYTYDVDMVHFEANPAVKADVAADDSFYGNTDMAAIMDKNNGRTEGILVSYTTDAKDRAVLKQVAPGYAAGSTVTFTKGSANVEGLNLKGTNDTQYLIRLYDWSTGKYFYKYVDGKSNLDASYVAEEVQYFVSTNNRYLTYVYIDATYTYEVNKAFIIGDNDQQIHIVNAEGKQIAFNTYKAVVNGADAIVAYTAGKNAADGFMLNDFNLYKSTWTMIGYTSNNMPIYANVNAEPILAYDRSTFNVADGVMTWLNGGAVVGDDLAADAFAIIGYPKAVENNYDTNGDKVVNAADRTYKKLTGEALYEINDFVNEAGWRTGYAWIITNADGEISEIYINVAEKL